MFPPAMARRTVSRAGLAELYRYSGLGCLFAAVVLLGLGIGWLVDRWLGTTPVAMLLGALGGAALATTSIYRKLYDRHDEPPSRDAP